MALVPRGERLGDSPGEVSELVEKAMRSPGVAELMVYWFSLKWTNGFVEIEGVPL